MSVVEKAPAPTGVWQVAGWQKDELIIIYIRIRFASIKNYPTLLATRGAFSRTLMPFRRTQPYRQEKRSEFLSLWARVPQEFEHHRVIIEEASLKQSSIYPRVLRSETHTYSNEKNSGVCIWHELRSCPSIRTNVQYAFHLQSTKAKRTSKVVYIKIKIRSYLNNIRLYIARLCPLALPYRVLRPMSKGMYLYLIICLKEER